MSLLRLAPCYQDLTSRISEDATVVLYNPPDPRKLRFLSVKPLKMNITAYRDGSVAERPDRRQDRLSDLAREAVASDFTRQDVKTVNLDIITLQASRFYIRARLRLICKPR